MVLLLWEMRNLYKVEILNFWRKEEIEEEGNQGRLRTSEEETEIEMEISWDTYVILCHYKFYVIKNFLVTTFKK